MVRSEEQDGTICAFLLYSTFQTKQPIWRGGVKIGCFQVPFKVVCEYIAIFWEKLLKNGETCDILFIIVKCNYKEVQYG